MTWTKTERIDSAEGNVSKFVFSKDDAVAEAVLYRYPTYQERTVICCSTQSGCPVGCRFCGAGDYFVRNLTWTEIVSQVEHCIKQTGENPANIRRLQVMFMSMGEPMLNFGSLKVAIAYLAQTYPNAALLISTIGPNTHKWAWSSLEELSIDYPQVGLQFSVHKSTDEERNKLIPMNNKLTLQQISMVGTSWAKETGRPAFFNYCAGDDNTSDTDANRLYNLFNPEHWNCTVSVICERNEGLPAKNEHQIKLAKDFSQKMLDRGFDVRVFDPAGQDDIGGGCGQLWFVQRWMQDHPDKAKPSAGHTLPVIHTPMANNINVAENGG